ncbi:hypothetical protein [Couchioplanes azureus]|uniref:hypothetical protein n=1 Tax=Couchioplanes caeruleus TaxID=56438 RepID=UPI001670D599|nr:hypothetical protein [Couchioplanes caeruleus]GGQ79186.1 hypothetical protein GCM10010166_56400 [Couchioplanes caeruleus subsp. azureus]
MFPAGGGMCVSWIGMPQALGLVLGPAPAAPIVTHLGGHATLYAATAAVTLLGAVMIRSVP